ncbi:MAG: uroporphyrinogen-III C-methyltransferase [Actinomycetota bacterium]
MTGRVQLVGAGPGDPELITVKGARVLAAADVVVYDRLAAPALLDLAPAGARRVYVGKEPGCQAMRQEEIVALLVREAGSGYTVVRLKGGDPFVFGRGGEEMLACVEAGVAVEVVPGVTSAIAAPASAGIPLTHRSTARSFAVVTGSTAHAEDTLELASMATATDTLVVLMAAGKLAATCETLIEAGRSPATPAAIVQWAWTEDERTVVGTLADLPGLANAATIGPPATLVIGDVVTVGGVFGVRLGRIPASTADAPTRRLVWRPPSLGNPPATTPPGAACVRHDDGRTFMASRMADRMSDLGERVRGRMMETRLDKVDRENDRLKHEVRLLREDLQEERGTLQSALDALKRDERVTVRTKAPKKRRGRILRTIVIGGGAYLLGARAGRERYDRVMETARGLKASMQDLNQGGGQGSWKSGTPSTPSAPATSPQAPTL